MDEFKTGKVKLLVATDVAARGIDIDQLPFVINYEIPNTPKTTCIASVEPAARALPAKRFRWSVPRKWTTSPASNGCLKREIPRLPLPLLGGERESRPPRERESVAANRTAEPSLSEEERRERSEQRRVREAKDSGHTRRAPFQPAERAERAALPSYPHFDFSKPYEPSKTEQPVEAAIEAKPVPPGKNAPRTVGAC